MSREELKSVPSAPGSLPQAIKALDSDEEFLLRGDMFTKNIIEVWIEYKREKEIAPMALRPHPYEFMPYHDV